MPSTEKVIPLEELRKNSEFYRPMSDVRLGGKFKVQIYRKDGTPKEPVYCDNIIPNVAIQHLGDILAGVETTYIDLDYMEVGTGTTPAALGNTDTETPATGTNSGRRSILTKTRNASSPYDLVVDYFIASGDLTRPVTITEITVFWNGATAETGDICARGVLAVPQLLSAGETATISYGLIFL
jgi:hypothetical protein